MERRGTNRIDINQRLGIDALDRRDTRRKVHHYVVHSLASVYVVIAQIKENLLEFNSAENIVDYVYPVAVRRAAYAQTEHALSFRVLGERAAAVFRAARFVQLEPRIAYNNAFRLRRFLGFLRRASNIFKRGCNSSSGVFS